MRRRKETPQITENPQKLKSKSTHSVITTEKNMEPREFRSKLIFIFRCFHKTPSEASLN